MFSKPRTSNDLSESIGQISLHSVREEQSLSTEQSMATMRAVDVKGGKGPISALFINSQVSKPVSTGNQALVKVKAFGLNRMDLLQREGKYPVPPHAPTTMGVEFSGVIEGFGEVPEGHFHVGDEVFGRAYGGAYAEYIAVSTQMLIHKPKGLSWEQAACIPETWITATQALYLVENTSLEWVCYGTRELAMNRGNVSSGFILANTLHLTRLNLFFLLHSPSSRCRIETGL